MIKKFIKKFLPNFVLKYKERYNLYKERKKFSNMDLKDVFKEIYLKKMWCPEHEKSNFKFYLGLGSYYPEFVLKYLEETSSFLRFNFLPSFTFLEFKLKLWAKQMVCPLLLYWVNNK